MPPLTLEELYAQADPLDLDDGRRAAHQQAKIQRQALAELENRVQDAAQAEHDYRIELAKRMLKLREAGTAATILSDIARGQEDIAEKKRERDIAEGMVTAQRERVRELEGERAMLRELLEYSRRATTGSVAA